jgi:hypothetical protein
VVKDERVLSTYLGSAAPRAPVAPTRAGAQ